MDQRQQFAIKSLDTDNFSKLCQDYGISRKTGYKWKERLIQEGIQGMAESSRRPSSHPAELPEHTVCEIIRLKNAHLAWGPRKIRALYQRIHPTLPCPSESSFKRILKKTGLTKARKKRRKINQQGRLHSQRKATRCNHIWTIDFKGWWKSPDKLKVEPLTVRDEYSRMILDIRLVDNTRTDTIIEAFTKLFQRYGLPDAIRSDNGPPFASTRSLLGLTRLSAWWLALGIDLERGRPGCPQDNGAHERMHRDISQELQAQGVGHHQASFDLWREEYNTLRGHEALDMQAPADLYQPSTRRYKGTPDKLDYAHLPTRKVHPTNGTITYQNHLYTITRALAGWQIALKAKKGKSQHLEVWFAHQLLGHIDPTTASFHSAQPGAVEEQQATNQKPTTQEKSTSTL